MGGTQNFVHSIYREKMPRYRVYRGTCFVVVVTKANHSNNQTEYRNLLNSFMMFPSLRQINSIIQFCEF